MAIQLVTRSGWGARPPKGSYDRISSTRGTKVHYTGGAEKPAMATNHGLCAARVRAIQAQHMDGNDWLDIGYSLIVCPHRTVFEGRGLHKLPAANGAGLNAGHYAVLGLVGDSGLVVPSDEMLHGIRDAIEYLRASGGAGIEIKGHRDGFATDCPGGPLYAWVRAGAPRPKVATTPVKPTAPMPNWTDTAVNELPTLIPGMTHKHVKTMRCVLFARGYEPANLHSTTYGKDDVDLIEQVNALKAAHGLAKDAVFGDSAWRAALA